jgi:hypothetical protein
VNKLQDTYKQYNSIKHQEIHIVGWFIVNVMTALDDNASHFQTDFNLGRPRGVLERNSTMLSLK